MNNQYPMQGIAQQLQAQGRYGDDVLVHMNPAEVAGLASLSPTGSLTRNPQTGQPEAFLPMLLIPMLASMGGTAAAGAMGAGAIGSAVAGGLASGVATGALTGDWERGLASGIMGAGIGGALGAAGSAAGEAAAAGTDAAATAATEGLLDAGTQAALDSAIDVTGEAALSAGSNAVAPLTSEATLAGAGEALAQTQAPELIARAGGDAAIAAGPTSGYGSGFDVSKFSGEGFMDALKQPFQEGSGLGGKLMSSQTMIPVMMGAGQLETMDANEEWEKEAQALAGDRNADRMQGYQDLQRAYRFANPGGYAVGGPVTYTKTEDYSNYSGPRGVDSYNYESIYDQMTKTEKKRLDAMAAKYGFSPWMLDQQTSGIDPLQVQAGLRGETSVNPSLANPGFRPGIDAEAMYFQDIRNEAGEIDPSLIQAPAVTSQEQQAALYPELQRMAQPEGDYLKSFAPPMPEKDTSPVNSRDKKKRGMAAGGDVTLNTSLGDIPVPGGGVASLPSEFINPPEAQAAPMPPMQQPQADNPRPPVASPEPGGEPSEQDIQGLALAITGQLGDKADMIVERFIQEFGVETFREAREFILKYYGGDNAQTEGMIQGQGGGMDDMIPGTIAGNENVAVSPGEYIVPADVVSGLGDGSSDAGATELDQMSDRVRMARGGSTTQPAPFDAMRVLPV